MFKWLGMILGLVFAVKYFALIPEHTLPEFSLLRYLWATQANDTVTDGIPRGEHVSGNDVLTPGDISDVITAAPEIKQLLFWKPFSHRYSAQGMAKVLAQETGLTINVVEQNSGFILATPYLTEAERVSISELLKMALGVTEL